MSATTIPEVFFDTAERYPSRVAFQIKEGSAYRRLPYQDAAQRVRRLAGGMRRLGLGPGDRVALIGENSPEWALAYLGIVTISATAVPLDVQLPPGEVRHLLEASGSRAVWASASWQERLGKMVDRLPARPRLLDLTAPAEHDHLEAGPPADAPLVKSAVTPPTPHTPASLLYTSGTTATPKGVLLSHANIVSNARSILASGLATHEDNFLAVLPLHHAYPFMVALLLPLSCGATITFLLSLKGPDLVACLHETGVTVMVGVPQLYAMIHRAILDQINSRPRPTRLAVRGLLPLLLMVRQATGLNLGRVVFASLHRRFGTGLRVCTSGGARLDPEVARPLMALGFTILEGYGLTETAPVVTFNPLAHPKPGSVGLPIPGVEVTIAKADGEVLIRGPNVMLGYDGQPEETARVIRDGWFHSGDQGQLDPDGYLSITGRTKDVIVLGGGKKVYPEEVEPHYLKSRFIKEICLIGLEGAPAGGEQLYAVIVPDFDALKAEGIPVPREAIGWEVKNLSRSLPPHRRITGFEVVKEPLPRTRLGKVQRHLVMAGVLERWSGERPAPCQAAAPEDEPLLARPPVPRIMALVAQIASARGPARSVGPVGLDDHLELDLGLDSLKRVELIAAVEQACGVRLPEMAEADVETVRDLITLVLVSSQAVPLPSPSPFHGEGWGEGGQAVPPAFPPLRAVLEAARHDAQAPVLTSPWSHWLLASLLIPLLQTIFRVGFRFRIEGPMPPAGPVLLTPNHQSYLDGVVMACTLPPAEFGRLYFLGDEQIFKGRVAAWVARVTHVVVVNVEGRPLKALREAAAVLRQDCRLCVFPEGGITLDGRLLPFKKGVGILMKELGVPAVPVLIRGTADVLPLGAWWPRRRPITITFGEPVQAQDLPPDASRGPEVEYEALAVMLRDRLQRMADSSTGR